MYPLLVKSLVDQIVIVEKLNFNNKFISKVKLSIKSLQNYAKELHQPELFMIAGYVYYYLLVARCKSYQQFYVLIPTFIDSLYSLDLPIFTLKDCEIVRKVYDVWNQMNRVTSSQLPFRLRKVLGKSKIQIGRNTFFKHSSNFIQFFQIAHFINNNKKYFPKMHGYIEFFLHLPLMTGCPGEYVTYSYVKPKFLDKYYCKVYDDVSRPKRMDTFLKSITPSDEVLKEYSVSEIFGSEYVVDYMKESLKYE